MGIKILHDIDTDGEVQGTSLDINGNADISGNTVAGGQLTLDLDQITTNIGTTSAISLRPGATTNTTGKSSIFLGTSTDDNYGISLRGARLGTNGIPTFEIGTHSNSANGTSTFVLDAGTLTLDTNMGTAGNFSGAQLRIDSLNTTNTTGFQGMRFATSTSANYGWSMGANRSSSGRGSLRVYEHINSDTGLERFTILQDGNVGIGTANPAVKLDIAAATGGVIRLTSTDTTVQAGESIGKIEFKSSDASTGGNNVMGFINSVAIDVGTKYALSFGTGSGSAAVERMRVDDLGNVGIGTTSPASPLHVAGTIQVGVDDTGHDVFFYGATSGKKMQWDQSADTLIVDGALDINGNADISGNITVGDSHVIGDDGDDNLLIQSSANENILIDSADDIILDADGGDVIFRDGGTEFGRITNSSGNLVIKNNLDDGDIIFQSDDGSGGVATYLYLDGGGSMTRLSKKLRADDNANIEVGSAGDLKIKHDGTNSLITNETGNLTIINNTDDGDIVFQSDDGSGGIEAYVTVDGGVGRTYFHKHLNMVDDAKVMVGTGSDLQIYHDGSNSFVKQLTGNLTFEQNSDDGDIIFKSDDGAGGVATYFSLDGSAATHDGSATTALHTVFPDKSYVNLGTGSDFQMHHNGVDTILGNQTGDLKIRQFADDKDIIFESDDGSGGVETYFFLDGSASAGNPITSFPDNSILSFGTGGDMRLTHNATDSTIFNYNGDLRIRQEANDKDILFQCDDGSGGVATYFYLDGSVGYTITQKHIRFNDNVQALFGTGSDLKIYHDSNFSRIDADGTGDLIISQKTADKDIIFASDDGSGGETAYLTLDGSTVTSIFSTDVTFNGDITIDNSSGDPFLRLATAAQEYVIRIDQSDSEKFQIRDTTAGVTALSIDTSQNATFTGTLTSGSFVANGETLTIGDDDNGIASITRLAHSDDAGGRLQIQSGNATGTNKSGGDMMIIAGLGTGSGAGGEIQFYSSAAGANGTTLRSAVEIAVIDNVGNLQIDGDLTVSGNDIKDSGGNSIISSDGSGVVTMSTGNILIGGSNANVTMNAGSDIVLEADNAGGGFASSIQYLDAAGGNKIMLGADSGVVVLANRAANGTVQIRANTSTAGSGGETTVVTVEDTKVDIAKDLNVVGIVTGKQKQAYNNNFVDDLGTTKHYIPFQSQSEQTTIYQEEAASLMPCDGRIVSVTVRVSSVTGSGNMTIGVNTIAPNGNPFSTSNWTEEETEVLAVASTDDYHVFHFAFSNAKHFDSGDLLAISIQNSADLSSNTFWYATTVVEYDWNTFLGGTSAEFDSNP